MIASIAYMDPGNLATNIQAGAKYGYALLSVVLLANLIAMMFQALCARARHWHRDAISRKRAANNFRGRSHS